MGGLFPSAQAIYPKRSFACCIPRDGPSLLHTATRRGTLYCMYASGPLSVPSHYTIALHRLGSQEGFLQKLQGGYTVCTIALRKAVPAGVVSQKTAFHSPRHMVGHTTPFLCRGDVVVGFKKVFQTIRVVIERQSSYMGWWMGSELMYHFDLETRGPLSELRCLPTLQTLEGKHTTLLLG
jgi:hypothetical protein